MSWGLYASSPWIVCSGADLRKSPKVVEETEKPARGGGKGKK